MSLQWRLMEMCVHAATSRSSLQRGGRQLAKYVTSLFTAQCSVCLWVVNLLNFLVKVLVFFGLRVCFLSESREAADISGIRLLMCFVVHHNRLEIQLQIYYSLWGTTKHMNSRIPAVVKQMQSLQLFRGLSEQTDRYTADTHTNRIIILDTKISDILECFVRLFKNYVMSAVWWWTVIHCMLMCTLYLKHFLRRYVSVCLSFIHVHAFSITSKCKCTHV